MGPDLAPAALARTPYLFETSRPAVFAVGDVRANSVKRIGKLIETGPVPHSVAIYIVRELLSGLGYIHESRSRGRERMCGLVHRDIKPRNVLLSWEGEVKLTDFGVAQALEQAMTAGANEGAGTPGYMSPEQASREALDGRSDLYEVGIVLWELLAHHRLRAGLRGDIGATISFAAIGPPGDADETTVRVA
jgi:serine/threonine protein kinase